MASKATSASAAEILAALPAWAVVTPRRAGHIAGVVELVERWARGMGVDPAEAGRWRRAALLHDALRDAPVEILGRHGPAPPGWPRSVWHGPAAAAAAAAHGESDRGVLEAVRFHSLGHAGWDAVGRMLYLADALEPGRRHERARLDALAARATGETDAVLREVTAMKLGWLLRDGGAIAGETWDFWNSLVADAS